MKVRIVTVGALKSTEIRALEKEYIKRLGTKVKIEFSELKPSESSDSRARKSEEGLQIIQAIKSGEFLIALDETGERLDSKSFATKLQQKLNQGRSNFAFVIGGAFGLSEEVKKRADWVLSLSPLTFPHQLARLVLVEQIYRAQTIINSEPYHK